MTLVRLVGLLRTCSRWLSRFDIGEELTDRSSAPGSVPNRTPSEVEDLIERLRRLRWTSTKIAAALDMATSTVGAVLVRLGLNRLSKPEPIEPPNRYCRRHPGELIHLDVKKLGRFTKPGHRVTGRGPGHHNSNRAGTRCTSVSTTPAGWPTSKSSPMRAVTAIGFLERAIAWFAQRGITIERVMTDNGPAYKSKAWASRCADHDLRHLRTRPYPPRTNGRTERFIQTMLREWAYAVAYQSSQHRTTALAPWPDYYNNRRPHGALGHKPPTSRLHADH